MMFKISMGLVGVLTLALGTLWWMYGNAQEEVRQVNKAFGASQAQIAQLTQDFADAAETNEALREELQHTQELISENRQARDEARSEVDELRNALREDRENASIEYQECAALAVPESTFDRLRSLASPTEGRDENGH